MGLAAGGGGALAGVIVAQASYSTLAAADGVLAVSILIATVVLVRGAGSGR